jgi:hypothetical protein
MKSKILLLSAAIIFGLMTEANAQQKFNAVRTNLNNLYRLSNAKTRSISPENPTGEKGKAAMATPENGTAGHAAKELGQGWKVNPYIHIKAGQVDTLADIDGPGAIKQIWMTPTGTWRDEIIRIYWDGEKNPSVEVPVGDFFASGWQQYHQISSLVVAHNPGSAFNSYWVMPFHKHCTITMENRSDKKMTLYYQINYALTKVPKDAAYFHAQYRQEHPVPFKKVYTIVDNIKGKGQYVGTYIALKTHSKGWWGEGEVKFYIDGDTQFPTISYTGTEDYFNGSYDFVTENEKGERLYTDYTTPYSGFYVVGSHKENQAGERFGMYRWHISDPIRFDHDLKVTIQDLGWKSGGVYRPRKDDISSVAYWYQTEPHTPFPELPSPEKMELHQ